MRPPSWLRATLLATLSLLGSAGAAQAGTVELSVGFDGTADVLYGTGSATADVLTLSGTGTANQVVVTPGAGTSLTLASGDSDVATRCTIAIDGAATCDLTDLGLANSSFVFSDQVDLFMGAGDDVVTATSTLTTEAVLGLGLIGEAGNDDLAGGPGPDYVAGDSPADGESVSGHDRLHGGDGSDYLDAGPGNDMVFANEGENGSTPQPDNSSDDGAEACGSGVDFLRVDPLDADRLQANSTCERRSSTVAVDGATLVTRIAFTPNNGRTMFEVGQVLSAAAASTDPATAPNELLPVWLRCSSPLRTTCVDLGASPTLTITRPLIGTFIGARTSYGWSIPENPWSPWLAGSEEQVGLRVGTESGPLTTPSLSTKEGTRDALLTMLLPRSPYRLRTIARLPMVGGANGFPVRASAKLTVPAKALGRSGSGQVVIAAGTQQTSDTIQLTLTLNAAGRKLIKRMRSSSKVKARYTVRVDVGSPALTASRTVPLTFKR